MQAQILIALMPTLRHPIFCRSSAATQLRRPLHATLALSAPTAVRPAPRAWQATVAATAHQGATKKAIARPTACARLCPTRREARGPHACPSVDAPASRDFVLTSEMLS